MVPLTGRTPLRIKDTVGRLPSRRFAINTYHGFGSWSLSPLDGGCRRESSSGCDRRRAAVWNIPRARGECQVTVTSDDLPAVIPLPKFLSTHEVGQLSLADRRLIVQQALTVLEQSYALLAFKVARYGINPL